MAVHTILVFNAGSIGHGIAQVAAAARYHVYLTDTTAEILAVAKAGIEKNLRKG
jgi:3-hydroxyacyl-CoA dehydrogenase